ncbi:MAG: hypothetical protein COA47_08125 [Robiginitomaculum sp.]|nr:MAG: hypothetical protein COA47_08125 [Robiginitomaculum sp.]
MAVTTEFKAFVCDHLSALGEISTRNMFVGAGVYVQGVMFALLADDMLYVKANEAMMADLAPLGCGPFMVDFGKGKEPKPMAYWTIPESAMDDPHEAVIWARRAMEYALSKKK